MRSKDGEVLSLNVIQFNPLYDRVVNPFIENLKALGVDGSLERIDRAQYIERRRAGNFDMTNQGFQMPFEPGDCGIGLAVDVSGKVHIRILNQPLFGIC